eukprot:g699.t1
MSINEIQDEIIDEFAFFDDWMDKYEYLISLGKDLPLIDEQYKDEAHLIKGCQSRVWLHADTIKDNIIAAIKTVMDPEIPADIYELGLIYTIELDDDGKVLIEMTLTSPMCPVADSMPMEVQEKVIAVEGVTDIDLRVVFDPPWDKSKMSEEAQLLLDMF